MPAIFISQAAIDLIVAAEIGSRAQYERSYHKPEWPGGASGVTIAIGYDVSYATRDKLIADWTGHIPKNMIDMLLPCCGVHGEAAHQMLASVRDRVSVPWSEAMAVFLNRDMPDWIAQVCKAIPGANKLSPDCLGALVSLTYNRGAGGFNDTRERFREMRRIKQHIVAGNLAKVADEFRAMARLWPNMKGLRIRREAEARLWEKGLRTPAVATDAPIIVNEKPTPLQPPPKPGAAESGGAAGTIVAGTTAATQSGLSTGRIIALIAVAVVAGIIVYGVVRYYRSQPVLARQKG